MSFGMGLKKKPNQRLERTGYRPSDSRDVRLAIQSGRSRPHPALDSLD